MKHKICCALTITILFAFSSAQAQFLKSVGIKAGVAVSNIRLTDVKPIGIGFYSYSTEYFNGSVVSPSVSLFGDFFNEDSFSIQAELTYLRKGASHAMALPVTTAQYPDGTGEVVNVTSEFSLHYLELALAAKPKLSLGDVALYGYVGPTAGYLLAVSNYSWLERYNRFQLGYTIGLGVDAGRVFNGNMFIELRYAGDFSPFLDQSDAKLWNGTWSACVGTTF